MEELMESRQTSGVTAGHTTGSNIIIVGATGAGKTTVGWQLARISGYGFIDLDEFIEIQEKKSVAEIFDKHGEEYFRNLETDAIRSLGNLRSHVVASGGGAVVANENWELFRSMGVTVWLQTSAQEIARRFMLDQIQIKKRPLLSDLIEESDKQTQQKSLAERMSALIGQRQGRYKEADFEFSDTFSTPELSAKALLKQLVDNKLVAFDIDDQPFNKWSTL